MSDEKQIRGWFATIAHDDPLIARYRLEDTSHCRLFRIQQVPAFEVKANGRHVCFLDPRDVLFAFGSDRISFLWEEDKIGFAEELSGLLKGREDVVRNAKLAGKIGAGIVLVGIAAAGLLLGRHLLEND